MTRSPATMIPGAATAEATRAAAARLVDPRPLGTSGLWVSPVGFGGYRIADRDPLHHRALADALLAGVNLIDTSTNYGDGRSEALVGAVLRDVIGHGLVTRESVVVVSKVGYIQGSNLAGVRAHSPAYEEITVVSPDLWHCIEPRFIDDQIEHSRRRLGLATIDVMLLHNPEYFAKTAIARGGDPARVRAAYDDRIARAFEALQRAVADGRIGGYGVSSNGFVVGPDDPAHTSVSAVIAAAQRVANEAGSQRGLVALQMPMNLLEIGATEPVDAPVGVPLTLAAAADVGVLVNRPLNAIDDGRLWRLAAAAPPGGAGPDLDAALAAVRKLEATWATGLATGLRTADGDDVSQLFSWAQALRDRLEQIPNLGAWNRVRHEEIGPHLGRAASALLAHLQGETRAEFAAWWERYGTASHRAFEAIEAHLRRRGAAFSDAVAVAVAPHLPKAWAEEALSRIAVASLLAQPITSALVGMRTPAYVQDVCAAARLHTPGALPLGPLRDAVRGVIDRTRT